MNKSYTGFLQPENNDKESNIDDLFFSKAARMAWMIASPSILILGTFGNGMSIAVYHRLSRKSQSSVCIYLIALAASDIMSLCSGLLVHWLNNMQNRDILATSNFVCKLSMWFIYTSGAASAWVLVAVTMQRAASVLWPHRVNSLITPERSVVVVLGLTGTLMLIHAHILFGIGVVESRECTTATQDYQNFFFRIWSWVDLMVFSFVPFAILLASNTILLKTVVTSVREARQRLSVGDKQQVISREKTASSMTLNLMLISFSFLILTVPICVYLLMKPYVFNDVDINDEKEAVRRFIFAVINLLWYSNSAINFFLYCVSGSKFRAELKRLLIDFRLVMKFYIRGKKVPVAHILNTSVK